METEKQIARDDLNPENKEDLNRENQHIKKEDLSAKVIYKIAKIYFVFVIIAAFIFFLVEFLKSKIKIHIFREGGNSAGNSATARKAKRAYMQRFGEVKWKQKNR